MKLRWLALALTLVFGPRDAAAVTAEIEARFPASEDRPGVRIVREHYFFGAVSRTDLFFTGAGARDRWLVVDGVTRADRLAALTLSLTREGRVRIFFELDGRSFTHYFTNVWAEQVSVDDGQIVLHRSPEGLNLESAVITSIRIHVESRRQAGAQAGASAAIVFSALAADMAHATAAGATAGLAAIILWESCRRLLDGGINRPQIQLTPWRHSKLI